MGNGTEHILVVDDEKSIRLVLKEALEMHQYQVEEAGTGDDALRLCDHRMFDLVLLDLKLPDMDGVTLLTRLHERSPQTIIIMLTAFATLDSAVQALRQGAYDYLTKPASIPLIIESVERGLLKKREEARRLQVITQLEQTLAELKRDTLAMQSVGDLTSRFVQTHTLMIDRAKRLVVRGDQPIALSATEFDLLDYLARHADRLVTASEIVKEIQGYDLTEEDARPLVRVHIQRLRQKLEDDPDNPHFILNVRGRGYRFVG
jgi:two-component system KDP operon response regulator KdpE